MQHSKAQEAKVAAAAAQASKVTKEFNAKCVAAVAKVEAAARAEVAAIEEEAQAKKSATLAAAKMSAEEQAVVCQEHRAGVAELEQKVVALERGREEQERRRSL